MFHLPLRNKTVTGQNGEWRGNDKFTAVSDLFAEMRPKKKNLKATRG